MSAPVESSPVVLTKRKLANSSTGTAPPSVAAMRSIENVVSPGMTYCETISLSVPARRLSIVNVPVGDVNAADAMCALATMRGSAKVPSSAAPENVRRTSSSGSSNAGMSASNARPPA
jgi:hypothetical protein